LNELRAAGFRTVQIRWGANWFGGAFQQLEGQAKLACRPASVARWVHDNLAANPSGTAFCASGNSNGASQLSYALAQYGLADLFSAVELDGGPNWSRLDYACLQDDPTYQSLWFPLSERNIADWSFGYPYAGTGPCATQDIASRDKFQEASIAYGAWKYYYPKTMVWFLFGELDNTTTAAHGKFFHQYLEQKGTPLLQMDIISGTDHIVAETPNGANAIRDVLINECRVR
jgi:hypothetical protein